VTIGTNPNVVCDMTSVAVRTSGTNANERPAASSVSSAVGLRGALRGGWRSARPPGLLSTPLMR
jgi:hypothetical protein